MAYNHFNNDLPVPPHGYADWRAFYADSLAAFSAFGDQMEPWSARVVVPIGGEALQEMPYWKIAHYAAREQALYDQEHPPLSLDLLDELYNLLMSNMNRPGEKLRQWLDNRFKEALERRNARR